MSQETHPHAKHIHTSITGTWDSGELLSYEGLQVASAREQDRDREREYDDVSRKGLKERERRLVSDSNLSWGCDGEKSRIVPLYKMKRWGNLRGWGRQKNVR